MWNSEKISSTSVENQRICCELPNLRNFPLNTIRTFDEHLIDFWDWSGEKRCISYRSWNMLKNQCTVFTCKHRRRYSRERARCRCMMQRQCYVIHLELVRNPERESVLLRVAQGRISIIRTNNVLSQHFRTNDCNMITWN